MAEDKHGGTFQRSVPAEVLLLDYYFQGTHPSRLSPSLRHSCSGPGDDRCSVSVEDKDNAENHPSLSFLLLLTLLLSPLLSLYIYFLFLKIKELYKSHIISFFKLNH